MIKTLAHSFHIIAILAILLSQIGIMPVAAANNNFTVNSTVDAKDAKASILTTTNYALQFDGLDDFVSIADNGSFDFNNAFSVEAWVKPVSLAGSGNFKGIVEGAFTEPPFTGHGWVMDLDRLDYSNWGLSVCVPLCDAAQSGPGNLQVGQWQHIAATYDGTNIIIYRNEVLMASTPWSGNVSDINFVLLGIWETSFDGLIDEVRIWNIARTQAAIQADMNHELNGNEPGLVGYWRFNEGAGQTVIDSTSGHNDGRLGSSAAAAGSRSGGSVMWRARIAGNMAGQLFLRSYERSDRVYNAMLARGYAGHLMTTNPHELRSIDYITAGLAISLILLLQVIGRL